ncbi:Mov34/MPN/PAD-1 family protein [Alicyclobacillus vulcanalis]|uniref:Mov34/MPN/PAD-1 family protein n=1 Tax=Alicyclobacillus vulcanalis TaxID=252246 RepID=UPI001F17DF69|nr:Mov34/MPN/PAD-1 family protein [Alicyclobacillus vulcanalis]
MNLRPALELHARQSLPLECAGLVVLRRGQAYAMALPAVATRQSFALDAVLWLEILRDLEKEPMEIWATYHSHPGGDRCPSRSDDMLRWVARRLLLLVPAGKQVEIVQYEWCFSPVNHL